MDSGDLGKKARELRREAIDMLYRAQSGHPGSVMSVMDVLVALYFGGILRYNPADPADPERDYFLLSNGHACPALYAVLADRGYFSKEEAGLLRQLGAGRQGHPHRGSLPGIEISSGSLGQGLSVGVGLAQALKMQGRGSMVWVMMSDGEQEEGSTWEAVMYAPKKRLDNLVAVVDKNGWQIDGATADVMPGLDPLADKYLANGWEVEEIDGNNFSDILPALRRAREVEGPVVVIAHTVRGKGVSFMENSEHWHAGAMNEEEYQQAMDELG